MRLILADGTVVDTADDKAGRLPPQPRPPARRPDRSARAVLADSELAERIRCKFKIKNTTGYSLNALVDFDDPSRSCSTC